MTITRLADSRRAPWYQKSTMTMYQIYGSIHGLWAWITVSAYRWTSLVISWVYITAHWSLHRGIGQLGWFGGSEGRPGRKTTRPVTVKDFLVHSRERGACFVSLQHSIEKPSFFWGNLWRHKWFFRKPNRVLKQVPCGATGDFLRINDLLRDKNLVSDRYFVWNISIELKCSDNCKNESLAVSQDGIPQIQRTDLEFSNFSETVISNDRWTKPRL
jgi:hypothetical protein